MTKEAPPNRWRRSITLNTATLVVPGRLSTNRRVGRAEKFVLPADSCDGQSVSAAWAGPDISSGGSRRDVLFIENGGGGGAK